MARARIRVRDRARVRVRVKARTRVRATLPRNSLKCFVFYPVTPFYPVTL